MMETKTISRTPAKQQRKESKIIRKAAREAIKLIMTEVWRVGFSYHYPKDDIERVRDAFRRGILNLDIEEFAARVAAIPFGGFYWGKTEHSVPGWHKLVAVRLDPEEPDLLFVCSVFGPAKIKIGLHRLRMKKPRVYCQITTPRALETAHKRTNAVILEEESE